MDGSHAPTPAPPQPKPPFSPPPREGRDANSLAAPPTTFKRAHSVSPQPVQPVQQQQGPAQSTSTLPKPKPPKPPDPTPNGGAAKAKAVMAPTAPIAPIKRRTPSSSSASTSTVASSTRDGVGSIVGMPLSPPARVNGITPHLPSRAAVSPSARRRASRMTSPVRLLWHILDLIFHYTTLCGNGQLVITLVKQLCAIQVTSPSPPPPPPAQPTQPIQSGSTVDRPHAGLSSGRPLGSIRAAAHSGNSATGSYCLPSSSVGGGSGTGCVADILHKYGRSDDPPRMHGLPSSIGGVAPLDALASLSFPARPNSAMSKVRVRACWQTCVCPCMHACACMYPHMPVTQVHACWECNYKAPRTSQEHPRRSVTWSIVGACRVLAATHPPLARLPRSHRSGTT